MPADHRMARESNDDPGPHEALAKDQVLRLNRKTGGKTQALLLSSMQEVLVMC